MNTKKSLKTTLALFVLAMILILPVFNSSAASTTFTMSTNDSVKPGEQFTLELSVSNNTGFAGFDLELHYSNTSLTLVKTEFSSALKNAGTTSHSSSTSVMPYKLTFASKENFKSNTWLVKFTFKLSPNAKLENHEVYVSGSVINSSGSSVSTTFTKGGVVAVCAHDTNESLWVEFNHTEATCISPSRTYYRCSECQQQKTVVGTQLNPHDLTDYEHKNATCVESGYDKQICKNCQTVVTNQIYDALGHKFSDVTNVVPPTCISQGYTISKCLVCNEEVKSDFTDKSEHSMVESSRLEPTCHSVGYIRYTCTVCSSTSESIVETVDHAYSAAEIIEPTHTTRGYTIYKCTFEGCTQSYTSDYTEVLPHTFEYTVVKEPTCTESGFKTGICTHGCNVTDEVDLPAIGHEFGEWYVAIEATQNYDGCEERVCGHCQLKETRLIPMLPKTPTDEPDEPKGKIETAVSYITDTNHPAIIAVCLVAVLIALVCCTYIVIKIKLIH